MHNMLAYFSLLQFVAHRLPCSLNDRTEFDEWYFLTWSSFVVVVVVLYSIFASKFSTLCNVAKGKSRSGTLKLNWYCVKMKAEEKNNRYDLMGFCHSTWKSVVRGENIVQSVGNNYYYCTMYIRMENVCTHVVDNFLW